MGARFAFATLAPHPNGLRPEVSWPVVLASVCAAALLAAPPATAELRDAKQILASEPPELVERLFAEELLVLEDASKGRESFIIAYVIFEKPVAEIVDLLRQASRQTEYRPELDHVETVRVLEDGRIDEQRIRIMFTKLVYRVRYLDKADTEGRLEWKLDPDFDNDLGNFEGFWELFPFAGDTSRTLARFGSNVNVGPMVPRFVQRGMSRKTVMTYLENCRKWINSGGEWRP